MRYNFKETNENQSVGQRNTVQRPIVHKIFMYHYENKGERMVM